MSEKIITIETSTECCSVALCDGGNVVASRVNSAPKVHAAMTAPYVEEVLREGGCSAKDLAAVAVSKGPGSYTGLRVGVSTAKGLCFGANIPLIGVDTLRILALQGVSHACRPHKIVPFIDARRMEVYSAVFDAEGKKLSDTEAVILDENSFASELEEGPVLFIGTGVEKFKEVCRHPNAYFETCFPLASSMAVPAAQACKNKEFEDTAYFEPFYLKEFVAGISKKTIL